jgi:hypothetical protein
VKSAFSALAGKLGKTSHAKEFEAIRNEAVFNIKEGEVNGNYEIELSFAETYTIRSIDLFNRMFDAYIGLFESVLPAFAMFGSKMLSMSKEYDELNKEVSRIRPVVYEDGSPMPLASRVDVDFSTPYDGVTFVEQFKGQNIVVRPEKVDSIRSEYSTEDGMTHIIIEKGNIILAGVVATAAYEMVKRNEPVTLVMKEVRDTRASDMTKASVERLIGSNAARYSLFDN